MFFPIGDVNVDRGYSPILTYSFIVINIVVFLFEFSLGATQQNVFVTTYGAIPKEIMVGKDLYTLITSIFLHGGWMHLIGNMLFLWVFADNIEATIGHTKFFIFYILGGIIASYGQAILSPNSSIPSVGASGAISACLGAYIIMFPKSQIKVLFLLFFTTFYVSAIYFLGIWIVQQLISGFGSLASASVETGGVAYWAHIAGFLYGAFAGFVFKPLARQIAF